MCRVAVPGAGTAATVADAEPSRLDPTPDGAPGPAEGEAGPAAAGAAEVGPEPVLDGSETAEAPDAAAGGSDAGESDAADGAPPAEPAVKAEGNDAQAPARAGSPVEAELSAEASATGRPARSDAPGAATPGTAVRALEPAERERTREQPAPPDQPMRALAALTNTPAPPPTLRRTVLRRVRIWTPLLALLTVACCAVQVLRPLPTPVLALTGASSYTFAGAPPALAWPSEGEAAVEVEGLGSLGTHGEQRPVPTASMAKVMTAYVVLHDHPLTGDGSGPDIGVDAQAEQESHAPDESTAPVTEGQRFTERQMLELLLIPSGNNIARLLGRWDAGTDDGFVAKMNAAARQLGMNATTYTDPSGLDAGTVSTAPDQLKLARAAMEDATFRSVVAMPNTTIDGIPDRIFNNNNDLVNPGVIGIKTGSSSAAGGNLMWAARQTVGGREQLILGVVMGQQSGTTLDNSLNKALAVSQQLMTQVQKALTSATVIRKGEVMGYVEDGLGGRSPVVAAADLTVVGWPGTTAPLVLSAGATGVPHSAKAGTTVGTLGLGSAPGSPRIPVALENDMAAPGVSDKLLRFG
ncbi:D-alanyl-D-alanine carboxypeptidase [Kitasatospora sp. NPDC052896]|uniref:D-alanyl-D-alanine carboxypeptidase n=1 Tax=Kitasatospora sp. NPDC052896 TaxID=3364061 RepID=UPI0037CB9F86